jgi:hypothetical protein
MSVINYSKAIKQTEKELPKLIIQLAITHVCYGYNMKNLYFGLFEAIPFIWELSAQKIFYCWILFTYPHLIHVGLIIPE